MIPLLMKYILSSNNSPHSPPRSEKFGTYQCLGHEGLGDIDWSTQKTDKGNELKRFIVNIVKA